MKRKSNGFRFFFIFRPIFAAKKLAYFGNFLYLCRVIKKWFRPQNNPNNSPFKTCKIMNKTVRKILQVISYFIAAILGAAGGSMM
jgi:hypothetical protein